MISTWPKLNQRQTLAKFIVGILIFTSIVDNIHHSDELVLRSSWSFKSHMRLYVGTMCLAAIFARSSLPHKWSSVRSKPGHFLVLRLKFHQHWPGASLSSTRVTLCFQAMSIISASFPLTFNVEHVYISWARYSLYPRFTTYWTLDFSVLSLVNHATQYLGIEAH